MRALAHPVRIALLDYLNLAGPATATQCAAVVGESASACSYHLRTLAKWGFIQATGGGRGREHPWRLTAHALRWSTPSTAAPARVTAAALLSERYLDHDDQLVRDYLVHKADEDPAWQAAAIIGRSTLYLTAGELQELRAGVQALMAPYLRLDPADRPVAARPVHVAFRAVPRHRPTPAEPDGEPPA